MAWQAARDRRAARWRKLAATRSGTGPRIQPERARKLGVSRQWITAGFGQQLDDHVVRACFEVRGELRRNLLRAAVRDERVDQPVAAAIGDIRVGETEAAQVRGVVDQMKVG